MHGLCRLDVTKGNGGTFGTGSDYYTSTPFFIQQTQQKGIEKVFQITFTR